MTATAPGQTIFRLEVTSGLDSILKCPPKRPFRALVTLDRRPIGWVDAKADISAAGLQAAIRETAGWAMLRRLTDPARVPAPREAAPLSIVVCAGARAAKDRMTRFLSSLDRLGDRNLEVIAIVRDPEATGVIPGGSPVRVTTVGQTGERLNRALNEACRIARHDVVVIIDAATDVDAGWTDAIRSGFAAGTARAMVSLSIAAGVGSLAESALDQRQRSFWGAPRTGYPTARAFDRSESLIGGLFAANGFLALRRDTATDLHFDDRLDDLAPGSSVGGMLLIHRLIAAGEPVVMVPAAFVWSPVPADPRGTLVRQGRTVRDYFRACRRYAGTGRLPVSAFALRFWFGRSRLRAMTRRGGAVLCWEWLSALAGVAS